MTEIREEPVFHVFSAHGQLFPLVVNASAGKFAMILSLKVHI